MMDNKSYMALDLQKNIFKNLKEGALGNFGNNFLSLPSRILPLSFREVTTESDKHIYVVTPTLDKYKICLDINNIIIEPCAYFNGSHSFLYSFMYITSLEFYNMSHNFNQCNRYLSKFVIDILEKYTKRCNVALSPSHGERGDSSHKKQVRNLKKLMNKVINKGFNNLDTDPVSCSDFSVFVKSLITETNTEILIIHSDKKGKFLGTTPEKFNFKGNVCVLLQRASGRFSPYGLLESFFDNKT